MMKLHNCIILAAALVLAGCNSKPEWTLYWEENFDGDAIDTTAWSRIPRGTPDWMNTQDPVDERLVKVFDGHLRLVGIPNDNPDDPAECLTGGIWTYGLKSIPAGRIEIRAKLSDAQGAWPALWTMGFDTAKAPWPYGGEIDIMERLNGDDFAYQTVHSPYTLTHEQFKHSATGAINPGEYNVYGVDICRDSLVMHINGIPTMTYYRDPEFEADGQYPYYQPQFLLMDMQLGGSWVGSVNKDDLPVYMDIDWVRCYVRNE